ncbi:MAG: hypothetical protein GY950_19305 [bacterium]|nr:hypothetical protein [bacterium]
MNIMKRKKIFFVILLIVLTVCSYAKPPAERTRIQPQSGGFVIEIQQGPRMTDDGGELEASTANGQAFALQIDLLKITPTKVVQIKSDTIKARDNVPVEYKFGFRGSPETEIISYTLKILPTITKSQPMEMQFKINLFQGEAEIDEKLVVIREHESVMVELLENKETASKLSFRITPFFKKPGQEGDEAYLEKLYSAEKQVFDDPATHRVAVNVKLLPVFAVDAQGNPVYDLKKEDIAFSINGKPVDILHLKPYEFGKQDEEAKAGKGKETLQKEPDRVIILIVDQVFNSWSGIKRAKDIAANIVRKGNPGDFFIIMTNTPAGGLKYIAGPDNDAEKLLPRIAALQQLPPQRLGNLYATLELSDVARKEWNANVEDLERSFFSRTGKLSENLQYKADVRRFSYVLSQFKYALRTIEKPKLVFLISRGVARQSFSEVVEEEQDMDKPIETDIFLFNYFRRISKAINEGGSVLYTINSQKVVESVDRGESGEDSLEEMAKRSGGQYFTGADAVGLANHIKRTLSAYYELVFNPEAFGAEGMNITVTSKRKGITVNTVRYSEIEKPYSRMETVQKKLFALNVVHKGNWSRMTAHIAKARDKTLKKEKSGKSRIYTKQVNLPEGMKNQKVDIFLVRKDTKKQKVRVDMITKQAGETVELKIKRNKNQELYYVIIEPRYVHCVYKLVR